MSTTTTALSWASSDDRNHIYYRLVAERDDALIEMLKARSTPDEANAARHLMRSMTRMGVWHLVFARELTTDPHVQNIGF